MLRLSHIFQSTHPRGVRQLPDMQHPAARRISIHAPTRGATKRVERYQIHDNISIHAPTRGATHRYTSVKEQAVYFNPRTHAGCDKRMNLENLPFAISIHAPTRGATAQIAEMVSWVDISIHAPTRGATQSRRKARET